MQPKFLLIVTETAGWVILDTPRARSSGALSRRAEPVGKPIHAYEIILFDGVPYAYLIPQDTNKPEWGRVGEKGSVIINGDGTITQVEGVKAYVKVTNLQTSTEGGGDIASALREVAASIRLLANSK